MWLGVKGKGKGKGNGKGNARYAVFLAVVVAALLGVSVNAQALSELPTQLLEKAEAAHQACSDLDDGQFAIEFGAVHRVLFANVHYSQCGGISPSPCVVASVWDDAEVMWRTTAAEWE